MAEQPGLRLRRIESGLYETPDGRYRVERVDSMGEWDTTSSTWVVTTGGRPDDTRWEHEVHEAPTKRACVEWLTRTLSSEETKP